MLKIYLTRHGQDEDNKNGILNGHRDNPLTSLGEEQARTLASKIKETGIRFDVVYSSPLKRALKTAEIVAEVSDQPKPIILNELIERNFGEISGIKIKDAPGICTPDILRTDTVVYCLSPKGGETFPDLFSRANKLINFIKLKHTDQSILLVTHGDFGKMIYAAFYNLSWQRALTDFHFGNSDLIYLAEDADVNQIKIFSNKQFNA